MCALAALVTGEQHPLLTVVAEHSAALTAVLAAMLADAQTAGAGAGAGTPTPPADGDAAPPAPGAARGRYEHIPIVVEPAPADD